VPGRWKPPKSEQTDAEVLRRKKELAEKLAFAVEYGTEDEFVAAVKEFKPDVGKEDLKDWIKLYHAARRAKRGL
jgi:undecaprenyl pyrophosphate synthase